MTLQPFHNIYRSTGGAPGGDLVLLHGWGLHSIVWDEVMPALLEHFQVTVIDLPGMGQSPLPSAPYTLELLVEQVSAVMPAQAHVLGWSLGGLLALALAQQRPQQVRSVLTVGTSARFTAAEHWPHAMAPALLERFGALLAEDENGTLIRFLALNCKGSPTVQDDVRKLKDILYFCGLPAGRALRGGLEILAGTDLRAVVPALSQPLGMLFGEHDHLVPASALAAHQTLRPDGFHALLADTAHVPFLSHPTLFMDAVWDFYRHAGVRLD